VKWILLTATVLVIITRAQWLLPIAVTLGTIYGFYLLFSVLLDLTFGSSDQEPDTSGTSAGQAASSGFRQLSWRERRAIERQQQEPLRNALRQKTLLSRLIELHGSLLISAVVVAILTGVLTILTNPDRGSRWADWMPEFAWLALPSLLGTWSMLILGKLWENDESDPSMRRFAQGLLGLAIGGATGWFGQYLNVDPTYLITIEPITAGHLPEILYPRLGSPTPYAYALYFGTLFVVVRWWRRTDPLRHHRVSLWSALTPPVAAVLICFLFPTPRGFLVATTTALSLQIAAPWMNERQRERVYGDESEGWRTSYPASTVVTEQVTRG
jgi:hypothetical protein